MFNLATQLIIYLKCKRRDYQDIVQYRRNGRSRRPFFHKSRCGLTETVHCFLFHVLNAHSSGIYCKSAPYSSVFISPNGGSSCDPIKTSSAALCGKHTVVFSTATEMHLHIAWNMLCNKWSSQPTTRSWQKCIKWLLQTNKKLRKQQLWLADYEH